jgi:hypothetical protein
MLINIATGLPSLYMWSAARFEDSWKNVMCWMLYIWCTYCNRPFLCVKCAGPHDTASYRKSSDTPATCALCGGPHPANNRDCKYYHRLYKNSRNNINNLTHKSTIINTSTNEVPVLPNISQPGHWMSYANAVKNDKGITRNNQNNTDNEDISKILGKFLDDFKSMFNQLINKIAWFLTC